MASIANADDLTDILDLDFSSVVSSENFTITAVSALSDGSAGAPITAVSASENLLDVSGAGHSYTVAVVGEVDAAKSTTIGVLTTGILDDSRGSARLHILSQKHEKETGRTSCINSRLVKLGNNELTFLDLAGHEKYFHTTIQGLTRYFPDFAILVVAANRGITRTTKEHYITCASLKIPVLICFSKIDICPADILEETVVNTRKLIKDINKSSKVFFYPIGNQDTLNRALEGIKGDALHIFPSFQISNVTGAGLDLLKQFLGSLVIEPIVEDLTPFMRNHNIKKLFLPKKTYHKDGIGHILFGINKGSPIKVRDEILIGPIKEVYYSAQVKSIHNDKREDIMSLDTDKNGCLALNFRGIKIRKDDKKMLKRVVILDRPFQTKRVIASVYILAHSTTIKIGYKPFINCRNVSIQAKILGLYEDKEKTKPMDLMNIGTAGYIELELPCSQFIYVGAKVTFRERCLKGFGMIVQV